MNNLFKITFIALGLFTGNVFSEAIVFNQELIGNTDNITLVISTTNLDRENRQPLFSLKLNVNREAMEEYYNKFGRGGMFITFFIERLNFFKKNNCTFSNFTLNENLKKLPQTNFNLRCSVVNEILNVISTN